MDTTNYLEWWFSGAWRRIAWEARTDRSKRDLVKHAESLAASNRDHYRIITPSHLRDAPPVVLHQWGPSDINTYKFVRTPNETRN